MEITGIITAIIVGAVIGVLGRLVAPGKQNMGILLTIVVGIVAALLGTWLASALLGTDNFLITLIVQVVLAAIGVAIVGGTSGRRGLRA
ncbi:MAG: GlsB/YeaQ/YmgE family stress response membrane protein [Actinomycetes bacterium]